MPLGNLTSQFFANVYLNELDQFVKHKLKAEYYIRYVDDFVILHQNTKTLVDYKERINKFLLQKLKIELHPDKSKIMELAKGIGFLGYRVFYHQKLLRKSNKRKFERKFSEKLSQIEQKEASYVDVLNSLQGWFGYAMWADTYKLRNKILNQLKTKSTGHPPT